MMSYLAPLISLSGPTAVQDQDDDYFGCMSSANGSLRTTPRIFQKNQLLRNVRLF